MMIFSGIAACLSLSQSNASFLSEEQTELAKIHTASARTIEDLKKDVPHPTFRDGYLTLEVKTFPYKGETKTFLVANSWSYDNNVGNIVLYPADTKPRKLAFLSRVTSTMRRPKVRKAEVL